MLNRFLFVFNVLIFAKVVLDASAERAAVFYSKTAHLGSVFNVSYSRSYRQTFKSSPLTNDVAVDTLPSALAGLQEVLLSDLPESAQFQLQPTTHTIIREDWLLIVQTSRFFSFVAEPPAGSAGEPSNKPSWRLQNHHIYDEVVQNLPIERTNKVDPEPTVYNVEALMMRETPVLIIVNHQQIAIFAKPYRSSFTDDTAFRFLGQLNADGVVHYSTEGLPLQLEFRDLFLVGRGLQPPQPLQGQLIYWWLAFAASEEMEALFVCGALGHVRISGNVFAVRTVAVLTGELTHTPPGCDELSSASCTVGLKFVLTDQLVQVVDPDGSGARSYHDWDKTELVTEGDRLFAMHSIEFFPRLVAMAWKCARSCPSTACLKCAEVTADPLIPPNRVALGSDNLFIYRHGDGQSLEQSRLTLFARSNPTAVVAADGTAVTILLLSGHTFEEGTYRPLHTQPLPAASLTDGLPTGLTFFGAWNASRPAVVIPSAIQHTSPLTISSYTLYELAATAGPNGSQPWELSVINAEIPISSALLEYGWRRFVPSLARGFGSSSFAFADIVIARQALTAVVLVHMYQQSTLMADQSLLRPAPWLHSAREDTTFTNTPLGFGFGLARETIVFHNSHSELWEYFFISSPGMTPTRPVIARRCLRCSAEPLQAKWEVHQEVQMPPALFAGALGIFCGHRKRNALPSIELHVEDLRFPTASSTDLRLASAVYCDYSRPGDKISLRCIVLNPVLDADERHIMWRIALEFRHSDLGLPELNVLYRFQPSCLLASQIAASSHVHALHVFGQRSRGAFLMNSHCLRSQMMSDDFEVLDFSQNRTRGCVTLTISQALISPPLGHHDEFNMMLLDVELPLGVGELAAFGSTAPPVPPTTVIVVTSYAFNFFGYTVHINQTSGEPYDTFTWYHRLFIPQTVAAGAGFGCKDLPVTVAYVSMWIMIGCPSFARPQGIVIAAHLGSSTVQVLTPPLDSNGAEGFGASILIDRSINGGTYAFVGFASPHISLYELVDATWTHVSTSSVPPLVPFEPVVDGLAAGVSLPRSAVVSILRQYSAVNAALLADKSVNAVHSCAHAESKLMHSVAGAVHVSAAVPLLAFERGTRTQPFRSVMTAINAACMSTGHSCTPVVLHPGCYAISDDIAAHQARRLRLYAHTHHASAWDSQRVQQLRATLSEGLSEAQALQQAQQAVAAGMPVLVVPSEVLWTVHQLDLLGVFVTRHWLAEKVCTAGITNGGMAYNKHLQTERGPMLRVQYSAAIAPVILVDCVFAGAQTQRALSIEQSYIEAESVYFLLNGVRTPSAASAGAVIVSNSKMKGSSLSCCANSARTGACLNLLQSVVLIENRFECTANIALDSGGCASLLSSQLIVLPQSNARFISNHAGASGGAIFASIGSTIVLFRATMAHNSAREGGAIAASALVSDLSIAVSDWTSLSQFERWAYLFTTALPPPVLTSVIHNTTAFQNTATAGRGGWLSISDRAVLIASDIIVDSNIASGDGGAMYLGGGQISLSRLSAANNTGLLGGAVAFTCVRSSQNCELKCNDCAFVNNSATSDEFETLKGAGGAIALQYGSAVLNDVTFKANRATNLGGAVFGFMAALDLSKAVSEGNSVDCKAYQTKSLWSVPIVCGGGAVAVVARSSAAVAISNAKFIDNRILLPDLEGGMHIIAIPRADDAACSSSTARCAIDMSPTNDVQITHTEFKGGDGRAALRWHRSPPFTHSVQGLTMASQAAQLHAFVSEHTTGRQQFHSLPEHAVNEVATLSANLQRMPRIVAVTTDVYGRPAHTFDTHSSAAVQLRVLQSTPVEVNESYPFLALQQARLNDSSVLIQQTEQSMFTVWGYALISNAQLSAPPLTQIKLVVSSDANIGSNILTIVMSGCLMGEQASSQGIGCQRCTTGLFSQMGVDCAPCLPRAATCEAGCLAIEDGYWWPSSGPISTSTTLYPCKQQVCAVVINRNATDVLQQYPYASAHVQRQLSHMAYSQAQFPFSSSELTASSTSNCPLVLSICAAGHVQSSPLCTVCDEGYAHIFDQFDACVECMDTTVNAILVTLAAIAFVVYLSVVVKVSLRVPRGAEATRKNSIVWRGQQVSYSHQVSRLLSILVDYAQLLSIVGSFHIRAPAVISNILSIASSANGFTLNLFPLQCLWNLDHAVQVYAVALLPALFAACLLAVGVVYKLRTSQRRHAFSAVLQPKSLPKAREDFVVASPFHPRAPQPQGSSQAIAVEANPFSSALSFTAGTFVVVMFLVMNKLTSIALSTFAVTEPIDGKQYVRTDYRLATDSQRYVGAAIVSGALLVCCLLLFVPAVFFHLYKHRDDIHQRAAPASLKPYAFIFQGYRADVAHWYEFVVLSRRLSMSFIAVFVPSESAQVVAAVWLLLLFALLHVYCMPYEHSLTNAISTFVLVAVTTTHCGTLWASTLPSTELVVVLLCVALQFGVVGAVAFAYFSLRAARKDCTEQHDVKFVLGASTMKASPPSFVARQLPSQRVTAKQTAPMHLVQQRMHSRRSDMSSQLPKSHQTASTS